MFTKLYWLIMWYICYIFPTKKRQKLLVLCQRSSDWAKLRAAHLLKEPECQACGRKKNLSVHHIIPVGLCPHKELDPNNLMTLCAKPCHIVFGHLMSYHCYNKDVRRMVAAYRTAVSKRIKIT